MKLMTIYQGDNKIELHNSILGKETVYVNNEEVSSKYSFWGTSHVFDVLEDSEWVEYELVTGLGMYGVTIDLYREGYAIIESSSGCRSGI
ncbi:MAG: hypothetical protein DWQ02_01245 [Bacteroidetes bacterium]|nr:MAG: hypothetical protein DWQ02_01245 [Bacteroidota bacterium]